MAVENHYIYARKVVRLIGLFYAVIFFTWFYQKSQGNIEVAIKISSKILLLFASIDVWLGYESAKKESGLTDQEYTLRSLGGVSGLINKSQRLTTAAEWLILIPVIVMSIGCFWSIFTGLIAGGVAAIVMMPIAVWFKRLGKKFLRIAEDTESLEAMKEYQKWSLIHRPYQKNKPKI